MKSKENQQNYTKVKTDKRILVVGAGRGNPFPAHYGMEIELDKINGEFLSYKDEQLLEKIEAYQPDLIIVHSNINKDKANDLARLKQVKDVPIAWWFCDLRDMRHKEVDWADMVFLCNKEFMENWKETLGVPVYYLPQSASEQILYSQNPNDYEHEIFFMGSWGNDLIHGDRDKYLEYIDKNYKLKWINSTERNQKIKYNHQSVYYYKHSPISLDISANAWGYTSNRPYEVLANKGLLFVKYFKGIEDVFENHRHCVWFDSKEEFDKWARYYLSRPEEREYIKREGHKLFLNKHTFRHRLQNIVDIVDGKTDDYYGYLS